ncbi:MAG: hypothetical protein SFW66_04845 [Gammaproteobacteria bacterium]|nr:hypothetical protein [Gammaproteobacteria bacterium]
MEPFTMALVSSAISKYGPAIQGALIAAYERGNRFADSFARKEDQQKVKAGVTVMHCLMQNVQLQHLLPPSFVGPNGIPDEINQTGILESAAHLVSSKKSVGPSSLYNPRWFPHRKDYDSLYVKHYQNMKDDHMHPIYECHKRLMRIIFNENGDPNTSVSEESRRTSYVFLKAIDTLIYKIEKENLSFFEARLIARGLFDSMNELLCQFDHEEHGKIFGNGSQEYLRTGADTSFKRYLSIAFFGTGRGLTNGNSALNILSNSVECFEKQFSKVSLPEITNEISSKMLFGTDDFLLLVCDKFGGKIPENPSHSTMHQIAFLEDNKEVEKIFKLFIKHYNNEFTETNETQLAEELSSLSNTPRAQAFIKQLVEIHNLSKVTKQIHHIRTISTLMGRLSERNLIPLYRTFFETLVKQLKTSMDKMKSLNNNAEKKEALRIERFRETNAKIQLFLEIHKFAEYVLTDHIPSLESLQYTQRNLNEMEESVEQINLSIAQLDLDEKKRIELYALMHEQCLEATRRVTATKSITSEMLIKKELISLRKNANTVHQMANEVTQTLSELINVQALNNPLSVLLKCVEDRFSSIYIDHLIESGSLKFDRKDLIATIDPTKTKLNTNLPKQFISLTKILCQANHVSLNQDGITAKQAAKLLGDLNNEFATLQQILPIAMLPETITRIETVARHLQHNATQLNETLAQEEKNNPLKFTEIEYEEKAEQLIIEPLPNTLSLDTYIHQVETDSLDVIVHHEKLKAHLKKNCFNEDLVDLKIFKLHEAFNLFSKEMQNPDEKQLFHEYITFLMGFNKITDDYKMCKEALDELILEFNILNKKYHIIMNDIFQEDEYKVTENEAEALSRKITFLCNQLENIRNKISRFPKNTNELINYLLINTDDVVQKARYKKILLDRLQQASSKIFTPFPFEIIHQNVFLSAKITSQLSTMRANCNAKSDQMTQLRLRAEIEAKEQCERQRKEQEMLLAQYENEKIILSEAEENRKPYNTFMQSIQSQRANWRILQTKNSFVTCVYQAIMQSLNALSEEIEEKNDSDADVKKRILENYQQLITNFLYNVSEYWFTFSRDFTELNATAHHDLLKHMQSICVSLIRDIGPLPAVQQALETLNTEIVRLEKQELPLEKEAQFRKENEKTEAENEEKEAEELESFFDALAESSILSRLARLNIYSQAKPVEEEKKEIQATLPL